MFHFLSFLKINNVRIPYERGALVSAGPQLRQIGPIRLTPALPLNDTKCSVLQLGNNQFLGR
jgi:hypothetical protein